MNPAVALILTVLPLALIGIGAGLLYLLKIRPKLVELEALKQGGVEIAGPGSDEGAPPVRTVPQTSAGKDPLDQALSSWQRTADAITDPVLIMDSENRVVQANKAAWNYLSFNGSEIIGKTCHSLYSGKNEPCDNCPMEMARSDGQAHGLEIHHQYLNRTFHVSCSPIRLDDDVVGYVHTAKDISHQRNLEKQLIQAQKMEAIATLAGGIAHDFNNILGAILGNADLLLFRLPGSNAKETFAAPPISDEEIASHVHAIKRAGNRAKDLVSQILAFSRQTSAKRRNVLIGPVVKEACKLLRASLPATIELKITISDRIGHIHADPTQIHQVLMNLCTNAVQALDDRGGIIDISLREIDAGEAEQKRYKNLTAGRWVVLCVQDNGRGMHREVLDRIFDPFFTTRQVGDGTGMGLAVLHGIIVAHNGVIDVQSNPGKGTQFTVFFPVVPEAEKEKEDYVTALPMGNETILFVDDEEDIVKMRTRMLKYLGYRVFDAANGEKALEIFSENRDAIDLVITDQTMPRMTGLELAARISALRRGLPIILCSGYSDTVPAEDAEAAGIRRFLAKPTDMRLLAQAIRDLLAEGVINQT